MNTLRRTDPQTIPSSSTSSSCGFVCERRQVAETAEELLRRDGRLFHAKLFCEFREGVLILRGRLPSYYLTQLAQTIVATVEGVTQVDNRIEVVAPAAPTN